MLCKSFSGRLLFFRPVVRTRPGVEIVAQIDFPTPG